MLGVWGNIAAIVCFCVIFGLRIWLQSDSMRSTQPGLDLGLDLSLLTFPERVVLGWASVQTLLGIGLLRYQDGNLIGAYGSFFLATVLAVGLCLRPPKQRAAFGAVDDGARAHPSAR